MQTTRRPALLVVVVALMLWPAQAMAKAWTPEKGAGYAKVWMRTLVGDMAFAAGGTIEPAESYQDLSARHYVEVGLTDQWSAVTFGTPIGWAAYASESEVYVGPIAVGVRRGLLDGPLQLALEAHYGYAPPVGERDLAGGAANGAYVPTVSTHFADGEVQAGYGFDWGWTVASAGLRWHSRQELDPVITGFGQVGIHAGWDVSLDLHFSLYQPLGDVDTTNIAGTGQTQYLGVGLGVSWWFRF